MFPKNPTLAHGLVLRYVYMCINLSYCLVCPLVPFQDTRLRHGASKAPIEQFVFSSFYGITVWPAGAPCGLGLRGWLVAGGRGLAWCGWLGWCCGWSGFVVRSAASGSCLWGCLLLGPAPWSRALSGSLSLGVCRVLRVAVAWLPRRGLFPFRPVCLPLCFKTPRGCQMGTWGRPKVSTIDLPLSRRRHGHGPKTPARAPTGTAVQTGTGSRGSAGQRDSAQGNRLDNGTTNHDNARPAKRPQPRAHRVPPPGHNMGAIHGQGTMPTQRHGRYRARHGLSNNGEPRNRAARGHPASCHTPRPNTPTTKDNRWAHLRPGTGRPCPPPPRP